MTRTTFEEIKSRRLAGMNAEERTKFDAAHEEARIAIEADEPMSDANEAPEISEGKLAQSVPTSQPSPRLGTDESGQV